MVFYGCKYIPGDCLQPSWSVYYVACRLLMCNKLLLHTTVPLPSLILLIQLLDMLQTEEQAEPHTGAQPQGTLVRVTSTLAEVLSSQLVPATC